jgi:hypothetical protein
VADGSPAQHQRERLRWRCLPFAALDAATLYALLQLRSQVFVVEQNCVYLDPDGADVDCHHLLGFDAEGRVQAALRLVPPGLKYAEASIGRVVTSAAVRGGGRSGERRAARHLDVRNVVLQVGLTLHPEAVRLVETLQMRLRRDAQAVPRVDERAFAQPLGDQLVAHPRAPGLG